MAEKRVINITWASTVLSHQFALILTAPGNDSGKYVVLTSWWMSLLGISVRQTLENHFLKYHFYKLGNHMYISSTNVQKSVT